MTLISSIHTWIPPFQHTHIHSFWSTLPSIQSCNNSYSNLTLIKLILLITVWRWAGGKKNTFQSNFSESPRWANYEDLLPAQKETANSLGRTGKCPPRSMIKTTLTSLVNSQSVRWQYSEDVKWAHRNNGTKSQQNTRKYEKQKWENYKQKLKKSGGLY